MQSTHTDVVQLIKCKYFIFKIFMFLLKIEELLQNMVFVLLY